MHVEISLNFGASVTLVGVTSEDIELHAEESHVNLITMLTVHCRRRTLHSRLLQLSHVNLIHSTAFPNAMSCEISSNAHSAHLNFLKKTNRPQ